ncbi:MAG: hypothetical protein ACOYOQ_00485 [Microthrixaceae bacterium]
MTERTRRATDAVEAHHAYLTASRPGTLKARIEGNLLDPTELKEDPRYGMGDLYPGGSFQQWVHDVANSAQTYTATTELFEEVLLTVEMIEEEGIDWLPLQPQHVPAPEGFILFPRGVENPTHRDYGVSARRELGRPGTTVTRYRDKGGGDRAMIDGFMWTTSIQVSRDGFAGEPVDGVTIIPITRWRGRPQDRPFRTVKPLVDESPQPMPAVVGTDLTAWAYDEAGATEWQNPPIDKWNHPDVDVPARRAELVEQLFANRLFVRSLVWATFRWLNEEVPVMENADRGISRRMRRERYRHEQRPEDGDVLVFDLRRVHAGDSTPGEGDPPWWRTRWTVRGHWAWRRYAIRDETGVPIGPTRGPMAREGVTYTRRQVWIDPYEKGPEWAPLVLREKVGVLNR